MTACMHIASANVPASPRLDLQLVHRTNNDEVFLTSCESVGEATWQCAIDAPISHRRVALRTDDALPLVVALEIQRQGGYAAAHSQGIPIGWRFVILQFGVRWHSRGPQVEGAAGFRGALEVKSSTVRAWNGMPRLLEFRFQMRDDHCERVASGRGLTLCLEPSRYAAMRKRATSEPALEEWKSEGRLFRLHWDVNDRFLFNRPDDHVVSMALLDALEVHVNRAFPLASAESIDAEFFQFAAATRAVWLHVSGISRGRAEAAFIQDGRVIARATVTITEVFRSLPT